MRRRRNHSILFAGLLALLAGLGLVAIISQSNSPLTSLDPTAHQQTVNAIVHTRLAETAVARTQAAAAEASTAEAAATQKSP
jgi:hypothetical protein